ncbi:hypothetical protein L7F22_027525, partial [Adiantum nelumboides]|nr:hypothetical protein [Adiantum nelumboides]
MASPVLHPSSCRVCGSRISAAASMCLSGLPVSQQRHQAKIRTRVSWSGSQDRSGGALAVNTSGHSNAVLSSDWSLGSSPLSVQASSGSGQKSPDTDVMGLLLRQRIVFLGFSLDEYVADAIISQLLLLDAQDPTKDIRLFINSPGGVT